MHYKVMVDKVAIVSKTRLSQCGHKDSQCNHNAGDKVAIM